MDGDPIVHHVTGGRRRFPPGSLESIPTAPILRENTQCLEM
jgi:hypothetical protein